MAHKDSSPMLLDKMTEPDTSGTVIGVGDGRLVPDSQATPLKIRELSRHSQTLAIRGAGAMLLRQLALKLLGLGGSVILARVLVPADFGLYALVGTVISFFNVVGDVGLGAAIIQQPEEPSEKQLRSVFTVQQLLASVVVLVIFAA